MEEIQCKLHMCFHSLPQNAPKKIYKSRGEWLLLLMINEILSNICWLIEVKIRLASEFFNLFVCFKPSFGKNTFAKKKRANWLGSKYPNCVWLDCNRPYCKTLWMTSENHEDKIKFIRVSLRKEWLNDILRSIKMRPSGYVQCKIVTRCKPQSKLLVNIYLF